MTGSANVNLFRPRRGPNHVIGSIEEQLTAAREAGLPYTLGWIDDQELGSQRTVVLTGAYQPMIEAHNAGKIALNPDAFPEQFRDRLIGSVPLTGTEITL